MNLKKFRFFLFIILLSFFFKASANEFQQKSELFLEEIKTNKKTSIDKGNILAGITFSKNDNYIFYFKNLNNKLDFIQYSIQNNSKETKLTVDDSVIYPKFDLNSNNIFYAVKKNNKHEIWKINTQTKIKIKLIEFTESINSIELSSNSKFILFKKSSDNLIEDIFILPTSEASSKKITDIKNFLHNPQTLCWSQNSMLILFISFLTLNIVDLDGKMINNFTMNGLVNFSNLIAFPSDSEIFVFKAREAATTTFDHNLYKINCVWQCKIESFGTVKLRT